MRIMFDVCLFACFPVSLLSLTCISFFVNLSLFCLMWIKEIFCGDSRYYHIKAIWLWNFVTGNHKTFKNFRSLSIFHQTILVSFLFVYVRFVLSFFLYLRPHKSFTKPVTIFKSFNHFVFIILIAIFFI